MELLGIDYESRLSRGVPSIQKGGSGYRIFPIAILREGGQLLCLSGPLRPRFRVTEVELHWRARLQEVPPRGVITAQLRSEVHEWRAL